MKLLDKKTISEQKSQERKKEIEEGVKLAKTVDALRDTKSKEEANLAKFRLESLKIVQSQIDGKVKERDALRAEIDSMEARRIELEAPVDLTKEWQEVRSLKQVLFDREVHLISRESLVQELEKRERLIREKEAQANNFFDEARKSYTKTDDLRNEMEDRKRECDRLISERLKAAGEKELDLVVREEEVKQKQDQVAVDKKMLLEKGTSLIERESKVESEVKSLIEREEQIKEREALTKRYGDEASRNYDSSENLKRETMKIKSETDKDIESRYVELTNKERDFGYKERDLILQREGLETEKKQIEKEKLHIASQQETLRQAWINIKRLQK